MDNDECDIWPRRHLVCEECGQKGSVEAPSSPVLFLDSPAKDQAELDAILARHKAACHGAPEA